LHSVQEKDLNLLVAAQVLLSEQSVTAAAARLHLSIPATSRVLERCRSTFGDPLLVRHGRGLVITPRGEALLAQLAPVVAGIESIFTSAGTFDPSTLRASFTIRANDAVIAAVGGPLLAAVAREAPDVEIRFAPEAADDITSLGSGNADLAIGSYGDLTGDLETEFLGNESLVAVLRRGHPAAGKRITLRRWVALDVVVVSRRGQARGPIDEILTRHGLGPRRIVAVVPSFPAALAMCANSDATTIAPRRLAELFAGVVTFPSPIDLPLVSIVQVWHGRYSADPAHRWLRGCVRRTVRTVVEHQPDTL
jgi:DNA-binding transcriptional LysR family regulator